MATVNLDVWVHESKDLEVLKEADDQPAAKKGKTPKKGDTAVERRFSVSYALPSCRLAAGAAADEDEKKEEDKDEQGSSSEEPREQVRSQPVAANQKFGLHERHIFSLNQESVHSLVSERVRFTVSVVHEDDVKQTKKGKDIDQAPKQRHVVVGHAEVDLSAFLSGAVEVHGWYPITPAADPSPDAVGGDDAVDAAPALKLALKLGAPILPDELLYGSSILTASPLVLANIPSVWQPAPAVPADDASVTGKKDKKGKASAEQEEAVPDRFVFTYSLPHLRSGTLPAAGNTIDLSVVDYASSPVPTAAADASGVLTSLQGSRTIRQFIALQMSPSGPSSSTQHDIHRWREQMQNVHVKVEREVWTTIAPDKKGKKKKKDDEPTGVYTKDKYWVEGALDLSTLLEPGTTHVKCSAPVVVHMPPPPAKNEDADTQPEEKTKKGGGKKKSKAKEEQPADEPAQPAEDPVRSFADANTTVCLEFNLTNPICLSPEQERLWAKRGETVAYVITPWRAPTPPTPLASEALKTEFSAAVAELAKHLQTYLSDPNNVPFHQQQFFQYLTTSGWYASLKSRVRQHVQPVQAELKGANARSEEKNGQDTAGQEQQPDWGAFGVDPLSGAAATTPTVVTPPVSAQVNQQLQLAQLYQMMLSQARKALNHTLMAPTVRSVLAHRPSAPQSGVSSSSTSLCTAVSVQDALVQAAEAELLEQYQLSEASFARAIELADDAGDQTTAVKSRVVFAISLLQRASQEQAMKHLEDAITRNQGHIPSLLGLAACHISTGGASLDTARALLNSAIDELGRRGKLSAPSSWAMHFSSKSPFVEVSSLSLVWAHGLSALRSQRAGDVLEAQHHWLKAKQTLRLAQEEDDASGDSLPKLASETPQEYVAWLLSGLGLSRLAQHLFELDEEQDKLHTEWFTLSNDSSTVVEHSYGHRDPAALLVHAHVHCQLQAYEEAHACLLSAIHDIDDDQQCLPCWALLGHMQYTQSVAADAVDDAQALEDQAIHSYEVYTSWDQPCEALVLRRLGHLYLKRKDRAKALQCFLLLCDPDRVVGEQYGSSPRMSTSFISVGTLCYEEYLDRMKSGDDNVSYWLEQSHTALQHATELNAYASQAWAYLIVTNLQLGDQQRANLAVESVAKLPDLDASAIQHVLGLAAQEYDRQGLSDMAAKVKQMCAAA